MMLFRRRAFSLPLLAKELTEQANQRRTYVIRVLYALTVCCVVGGCIIDVLWSAGWKQSALLGRGGYLFDGLVYTQFFGVYLLLPAVTCGVLTQEKERNTLELLLLTKLGPWTIVLEKLLGQLVPMASFVMLSLPLLSVAYALGGVSRTQLWSGVWLLLVASLHIGSLSVMCSAWFRTTVGAFIATYVLGSMVCFALPVLEELRLARFSNEEMFFAPAIFDLGRRSVSSIPQVLEKSVPMLLTSVLFLGLARAYVVRRASVPAGNPLMTSVKFVDRLFAAALMVLSRGRFQLQAHADLPDEKPVLWRETARTVLGRLRYRVYMSVATTVLVGCVLALIASNGGNRIDEIIATYFIFLGFVLLLVCVKSASLLASERSHQTLDILLATPLTNREIVQQKFQSVLRFIGLFASPFLVIVCFDANWQEHYRRGRNSWNWPSNALFYGIASIVTVAIYLPMFAWLSLLIGLRVRSQIRAIFLSVVVVAGWGIGSAFAIVGLFDLFNINPGDSAAIFLLLSPFAFPVFNEVGELHALGPAWLSFTVNSLLYGTMLVRFRWLCLSRLDRHMQRDDGESGRA